MLRRIGHAFIAMNNRWEIRSWYMKNSKHSNSVGSIPCGICWGNRICGLWLAKGSPNRGSCKSKAGSARQRLSLICKEEIAGFCGSATYGSESSPEDGWSSNTSVVFGLAGLDRAVSRDKRWGPWIFGTFWGRSLDRSRKIRWLGLYSQISSYDRFVHFTQYLRPDPLPIMPPSTIAVANASPKVCTIFFFSRHPHQYCELQRRAAIFFQLSRSLMHQVKAQDQRFPMP